MLRVSFPPRGCTLLRGLANRSSLSGNESSGSSSWFSRVPRREGLLRLVRQTLRSDEESEHKPSLPGDIPTKSNNQTNNNSRGSEAVVMKETCLMIRAAVLNKEWGKPLQILNKYHSQMSSPQRVHLLLGPVHQILQASLHNHQPTITQELVEWMRNESVPIHYTARHWITESLAKLKDDSWTIDLWQRICTKQIPDKHIDQAFVSVLRSIFHAEKHDMLIQVMRHVVESNIHFKTAEFYRVLVENADIAEDFGCSFSQLLAFLDKARGWERNRKVLQGLSKIPDSQQNLVLLFKFLDRKRKEGYFDPEIWPYNELIQKSYKLSANSAALYFGDEMKKFHMTPSGQALAIWTELSYKAQPNRWDPTDFIRSPIQGRGQYKYGLLKGILSHPRIPSLMYFRSLPASRKSFTSTLYEMRLYCQTNHFRFALELFRHVVLEKTRVIKDAENAIRTRIPNNKNAKHTTRLEEEHEAIDLAKRQIERVLCVFSDNVQTPQGRKAFFEALQVFAQQGLRIERDGRLHQSLVAMPEWVYEATKATQPSSFRGTTAAAASGNAKAKENASQVVGRLAVDQLLQVLETGRSPVFLRDQIQALAQFCTDKNAKRR